VGDWLMRHLWNVHDLWDIREIELYMTFGTFVKCIWFVGHWWDWLVYVYDSWEICEMYLWHSWDWVVAYLWNSMRLNCGTFVKCIWLVGHCESELWDVCGNVCDLWDICETDLYTTYFRLTGLFCGSLFWKKTCEPKKRPTKEMCESKTLLGNRLYADIVATSLFYSVRLACGIFVRLKCIWFVRHWWDWLVYAVWDVYDSWDLCDMYMT